MKRIICNLGFMLLMILPLVFRADADTGGFCSLKGDADGDGTVSAADARLALRASVGLENITTELLMRSDTDSDSQITAADARLILRRAVGLEPGFTHTAEISDAAAPGCVSTGLSAGEKCSLCGEILIRQELIPAKGHTEKTVDGVPATCTQSGLSAGKLCSVCGKILIKQESLPAKGHISAAVGALEPSFEADGLTDRVFCTVCGETLRDQTVIPALKRLLASGSAPVSVNNAVNAEFPWVYCPEKSTDDAVVYRSSNAGVNSSASNLSLTVTGSGILSFDVFVSSEAKYDGLTHGTDGPFAGRPQSSSDPAYIHGEKGWQHTEMFIKTDSPDAVTVVYVGYTKDVSNSSGEDMAAIKNICYSTGEKEVTLGCFPPQAGEISGTVNDTALAPGKNKTAVGETVTVTAAAKPGYEFLCIKDASGEPVSFTPCYETVIRENCSFTAEYIPSGRYEARINGTVFHTLNEALSAAKSGETVFVLKDCTLTENAAVKSGVTVVIPCADNDPGYRENGYNPDGTLTVGYTDGTLYRTVTVPEGVNLAVYGTVLVNAVTSRLLGARYEGYGITGGYAKIVLNGNITVFAGGLLDVAGMVEGGGTAVLESGAKMYETYSIDLWRGGTFSVIYDCLVYKNYPIYASTMNNLRTELIVKSGASLCGTVKLYYNTCNDYCRFPVIDNANGLCRLHKNAYCRRTVIWDETTSTKHGTAVTQGGLRDVYAFYGGADFSSCALTLAGMALTTDYFKYFNVDGDRSFLLNSGVYNIKKWFRFLPGFIMRVNDGAEVNVSGGLMFTDNAFTRLDSLYGNAYYTYPTLRQNACMVIANGGKLFVAANGEISGTVKYENAESLCIDPAAVKTASFPVAERKNNDYIPNEYRADFRAEKVP